MQRIKHIRIVSEACMWCENCPHGAGTVLVVCCRVGDKYMSSVMTWVESALLLSGGACILLFVFLAVVEVDLSFGEDALERELGALDPRGTAGPLRAF